MFSESPDTVNTLGAIAVLIHALAWPFVALLFILFFRKKIASIFDVLTQKMKNAKRLKAGQVEIDAADEITRVVNHTAELAGAQDAQTEIPKNQIEAAQLVGEKLEAAPIPYSQKVDLAHKQIYELVDEYQKIRETEPKGPDRNRKMNQVAAKMRTLAVVAYPFLPSLISGKRAGERLAAICILQVRPELNHFFWLIDRVMQEEQSFLLFHASVAIFELVKSNPLIGNETAGPLIRKALKHVSGTHGGKPDQNIVDTLNEVLKRLQNQPSMR